MVLAMGKGSNTSWNKSIATIVTILLLCIIQSISSECPRYCECKWKSGKESVLCLNSNITEIPKKLDAGTQVLDLTGNDIVSIERDAFSKANLLNLQKIFIAKCRLKLIDRYAFRNLINLVELDLSYNALNMIPSHVFDSIPELREIKLNGNPIQRLPNDAFTHVPQLVRLELSDCKIGTIEIRAFSSVEASLEWLKLDGNKLTDIKSSTLTTLHNLHGLELARNPWNCTCSLRPLREWLLKQNIPHEIPPICRYPARLSGKSWDRLELDDFACTPFILAFNSKAYSTEGKNVTMNCRIGGVPEPNVRWILRNRVIANITNGNAVLPTLQGRKMYMVHVQKSSSNLTILTTDLQDAGTYICAAENKAGRVESSVTLTVSRKQSEGTLSAKVLIVSIIAASLFIVSSMFVVICFCSLRKRRKLRNWTSSGRRESYEKIELNHKPTNVNYKSPSLEMSKLNNAENGISFVGLTKRNGDYRNVPSEDDGTGCEDNCDTNFPNRKENFSKWKFTANCGQSTDVTNGKNGKDDREHESKAIFTPADEADLHIPRLIDFRSDGLFEAKSNSTVYDHSNLSNIPGGPLVGFKPNWSQHIMKKQNLVTNNVSLYTSEPVAPKQVKTSDKRTAASDCDTDNRYPDLLDISRLNNSCNNPNEKQMNLPSNFCTLPRRKTNNFNKYFHAHSTDSQSPLLPECSSRYGSSCFGDLENENRRFSIDSHTSYPFSSYSLNKSVKGQRSNSFLNLVSPGTSSETSKRYPSLPSSPSRETSKNILSPSATPLLDFSTLPIRSPIIQTPSSSTSTAPNAYDYHAAQLERFLDEYRNLQEQLCKMKETCETIRRKETPLRTSVGQSAKFADPLMYSAVISPNILPEEPNTKSILKNKSLLPGQPPEPPPYWLHRNAMLKKLNDPTTDFFQS